MAAKAHIRETSHEDQLSPRYEQEYDTLSTPKAFGQTESNILARLVIIPSSKDKFSITALFKLKDEKPAQGTLSWLHLWQIWGPKTLEPHSILAKCEVDSSAHEVDAEKVSAAYHVLEARFLNNYSLTVKVRRIDPKHARSALTQPATQKAQSPVAKSLQSLLEGLAPTEGLFLKIKVQKSKEFIEPDHKLIVHSISSRPLASGVGDQPEKGSVWRLVDQVTPEGLLETSGEYKVLDSWRRSQNSRGHSTANWEVPSAIEWEAEFEKVSAARKIFSIADRSQV